MTECQGRPYGCNVQDTPRQPSRSRLSKTCRSASTEAQHHSSVRTEDLVDQSKKLQFGILEQGFFRKNQLVVVRLGPLVRETITHP